MMMIKLIFMLLLALYEQYGALRLPCYGAFIKVIVTLVLLVPIICVHSAKAVLLCRVQVNAIKLSPGVVFSEDGRVKEGPQPVSSNTGAVLALTHRDHY